jgi:iron uptake system EfeUOB component EfeO/EfeM
MKPKKSAHVPGQLYGYSLQTTRATGRLLQSPPGFFVSVEVFDDVGVEGKGGEKTAEQTKSAVTTNPIADRSLELWKTFSNWLDAVEHGEIDAGKTLFELHLSKKRAGAIAESFAAADDSTPTGE